jgi:hypothetical protein
MNFWDKIAMWIKFKIYAPLRLNRFNSYNLSCSQFGEDMIVRHVLEGTNAGFYVDIGAHHPVHFSNTYHFYLRGWRGINIDAIPASMDAFRLLRPRDINIEACVDSAAHQTRVFTVFDVPALNTASLEEAQKVVRSGKAKMVMQHQMETTTLTDLLDLHLPSGGSVDLLTIDAEGLDEVILQHHDFGRYRPRVLLFERKEMNFAHLDQDDLIIHLKNEGYEMVAFSGPSIVMRLSQIP